MTMRRPMRRTGKCSFQAVAQSSSWTALTCELADGPQPEGREVAEAFAGLRDGGIGGARGRWAGR